MKTQLVLLWNKLGDFVEERDFRKLSDLNVVLQGLEHSGAGGKRQLHFVVFAFKNNEEHGIRQPEVLLKILHLLWGVLGVETNVLGSLILLW